MDIKSPDFWKQIASFLEKEPVSAREGYIQSLSKKIPYSAKTIRRKVKELGGFNQGRKLRKDAFVISPELNKQVLGVAALYHDKIEKEARTSLKKALNLYRRSLPDDTKLPSMGVIREKLNRKGLSRKDVRKGDPTTPMRSLYPNHVHEMDSTSLYALLKKEIIPLFKKENYKNKPANLNDPDRLIMLVMVDHFSDTFFPYLTKRETKIDVAEFVYLVWNGCEYFPFHGVPNIILKDNASAFKSYSIQRLFHYLGVKTPVIEKDQPQAKGTVECKIRDFQNEIEETLRLIRGEITLDELNDIILREAARYQGTEIHSRHGQTRSQCWLDHIGDNLRELPSWEQYKQLLYTNPKKAKVDSSGYFWFNKKKYRIKGIYDNYVDVFTHPFDYEKTGAVTIQYPSIVANKRVIDPEKIQTATILPEEIVSGGFVKSAAIIGEEYKAQPETITQKSLKEMRTVEIDRGKIVESLRNDKTVPLFITPTGQQITAISALQRKEIMYTKSKAKIAINDQLKGGRFSPEELEIINQAFKDVIEINEKQVDELTETIRSNRTKSNIIKIA